MKTTSEEKKTTRELYDLYKAEADALRTELCKLPPLEAAVTVLALAQELTTEARFRLLGDLRRWTQRPVPTLAEHSSLPSALY